MTRLHQSINQAVAALKGQREYIRDNVSKFSPIKTALQGYNDTAFTHIAEATKELAELEALRECAEVLRAGHVLRTRKWPDDPAAQAERSTAHEIIRSDERAAIARLDEARKEAK